jgi:hypothetical protein
MEWLYVREAFLCAAFAFPHDRSALSSVYAPILLLAFVCVAFACKEPEDNS